MSTTPHSKNINGDALTLKKVLRTYKKILRDTVINPIEAIKTLPLALLATSLLSILVIIPLLLIFLAILFLIYLVSLWIKSNPGEQLNFIGLVVVFILGFYFDKFKKSVKKSIKNK